MEKINLGCNECGKTLELNSLFENDELGIAVCEKCKVALCDSCHPLNQQGELLVCDNCYDPQEEK